MRAPGVVKGTRELFVPFAEQAIDVLVAFVVAPRGVSAVTHNLIENTFAEPIECYLP